MSYPVVRVDKMLGVNEETYLVSAKFATKESTNYTPAGVNNGCPVLIDGVIPGERDLHWAIVPAANSDKTKIAVVTTPEITDRNKPLDQFTNEAGDILRGHYLHTNDEFGVTAEALDGTPAVGSLIELEAGAKWKVVTSATSGSTQIGDIKYTETVGGYTYWVIHVN